MPPFAMGVDGFQFYMSLFQMFIDAGNLGRDGGPGRFQVYSCRGLVNYLPFSRFVFEREDT